MKKNLLITLTSEDLVDLLLERSVKRGDFQISCQDSFLASLACLSVEMGKRLTHDRSASA